MSNAPRPRAERPLYEQVADERRARGWTQEETAAKVGMSLRAYGAFELGQTTPRSQNMRAILYVFGLDESGEEARDETLESWPPDVRVFLDMLGAYLMTMTEAERLDHMHAETRRVFGRSR